MTGQRLAAAIVAAVRTRMKTDETVSRRLPSALTTRLLVWLGLRSDCCGARLYEPTGWAREYCSKCDRRVS